MATKYKNSIGYDKRDYIIPDAEDEKCGTIDSGGLMDEDSPTREDDMSEVSSEILYSLGKLSRNMAVPIFDKTDILVEDIQNFVVDVKDS